jgi:hypothetical protein
VRAVKAAKRSPIYRRVRRRLRGPAPCDVWRDDDQRAYIVLFPLDGEPDSQSFFGFAVSSDDYQLWSAGVLSLALSADGWRVRHHAQEEKESLIAP